MGISLCYLCFTQNVKAYFRRGTAREMLGYYKEAIDGKILILHHICEHHSYHFFNKIVGAI